MKLLMVGLMGVVLLAGASPAGAFDGAQVQEETRGIFTTILQILVKWIFPIGAAYCFLYGIIGRGVKRGEWDMAAVCTIAAVALALFPKLLQSLFEFKL
jgi:hypothetical protein